MKKQLKNSFRMHVMGHYYPGLYAELMCKMSYEIRMQLFSGTRRVSSESLLNLIKLYLYETST